MKHFPTDFMYCDTDVMIRITVIKDTGKACLHELNNFLKVLDKIARVRTRLKAYERFYDVYRHPNTPTIYTRHPNNVYKIQHITWNKITSYIINRTFREGLSQFLSLNRVFIWFIMSCDCTILSTGTILL